MGGIDTPQLKKRRVSVSDGVGNDAPAPMSQLLVKRLSDKAKIPTRGSSLAAGYDLYR
jgi:dUTP pyrophosphatase